MLHCFGMQVVLVLRQRRGKLGANNSSIFLDTCTYYLHTATKSLILESDSSTIINLFSAVPKQTISVCWTASDYVSMEIDTPIRAATTRNVLALFCWRYLG